MLNYNIMKALNYCIDGLFFLSMYTIGLYISVVCLLVYYLTF